MMPARCRWQLRLVEGALRRGDWLDARTRVLEMDCDACQGCSAHGACTGRRGYLHGLSLAVKLSGAKAGRRALSDPGAAHAQTTNSASS